MTTISTTQRLHTLKNSGLPYVLLLSTLFGTSLISSRFALKELSSLTFIGIRMTISTICFLGIFTFSKTYRFPTNPKIWRHGFVLGIIGTTIPMVAFISSLSYLSSGVAAIIGTVGPAFTVVLAHFLLKDDKLTRQKAVGVILALSGAILLTLMGETGLADSGEFNPTGYLLIFCSTISSGLGIIYARKHVRELGAIEVTSVRVFVSMLITLPLGFLLYNVNLAALSDTAWMAISYSSVISSFAGFILALYIINNFGVATSIMTNYCVPIVATIGGALILDEKITIGMLVGMAIISSGLYLINAQNQRA